jgi:hypothetical protein
MMWCGAVMVAMGGEGAEKKSFSETSFAAGGSSRVDRVAGCVRANRLPPGESGHCFPVRVHRCPTSVAFPLEFSDIRQVFGPANRAATVQVSERGDERTVQFQNDPA